MAFSRSFAEALRDVFESSGWNTLLPDGELQNPLQVPLSRDGQQLSLLIHARQLTRQVREGANPSTHNRPEGELHLQMIFDGDQRGAGYRNTLRFMNGYRTLLLGFYSTAENYVIAAYDPMRHREYAYSKSLQLRQESIDRALKVGLTFQIRTNGEVVVIFPLDSIEEYLQYAEDYHQVNPRITIDMQETTTTSLNVKQAVNTTLIPEQLPQLTPQERKRVVREIGRYIRDRRFEEAIKRVYERCAICDFQYDDIIDAAHIVSVADGGTDTYDNGLGLCPNCHRMYDRGLILVDGSGKIYLNSRYVEGYAQSGRAGSLESLGATLRKFIWQPLIAEHHPSPENLQRTFEARR